MKKVIVIGAGGIGSRIVPLLQGLVDSVAVMDYDVLEDGNLGRQLYTMEHVGMSKVEALAKLHPFVEPIDAKLESPEQLEGYDMIICVPDNHSCRVIALAAADLYGSKCIVAGNGSDTANANYYDPQFKGTFADPRIAYPDMLETAVAERSNSCSVVVEEVPQTALANAMAASFATSLFTYWNGELPPYDIIVEYSPFEYRWMASRIETMYGVAETDEQFLYAYSAP